MARRSVEVSLEPGAHAALQAHLRRLRRCRRCERMHPPVVTGTPVVSPVLLIGQAPGAREGGAGRPFAWTAGRTLFRWFEGIGLTEDLFRERVYMAAVCRCFPGKARAGGDRVPDRTEIEACRDWLRAEAQLLRPRLVIPVGRLAIGELLEVPRLDAVIGHRHRVDLHGASSDAIPLPHPSGASSWHKTEPGRSLLGRALALIARHEAWRSVCRGAETP